MRDEVNILMATNKGFANNPLWAMQAVRAATYQDAPVSTMVLDGIVRKLEDYSGQMRAGNLNPDVFKRADDVLKLGSVPEPLKKLITALYDEGVELSKVFGNEIAAVKLKSADAQAVTEEIKRFGNVHNMVGFHHIKEFFDAARQQSQAALFHEERLMSKAQFDAVVSQTNELLHDQGHYGVHHAVAAHPSLATFLSKDTRPITVDYAKSRATHGVGSISNYTRTAYLKSEQSHAAPLGEHAASYVDSSLHTAMGADYINSHSAKWQNVRALTSHYEANEAVIAKPNAVLKDLMVSKGLQTNITAMFDARKDFIGKHALALLDPKTAAALGKAGTYDKDFWGAIDEGMHNVIGSPDRFAPHINAMANGEAPHAAPTAKPAIETPALPKPDSEPTQKKTAGQGASSKPSSHSPTESSASHSLTTEARAEAKTAKSALGNMTAGRAAATGIFGLAVVDGIAHLRDKPTESNAENNKEGAIRFGRVLEISVGVAGIAAAWLTKNHQLEKLFGSGKPR